MGGYHIIKILHLSSIAFWSSIICFFMNQDMKWPQWLVYIGTFVITLMTGSMLMMTQGINLNGTYPSWVYLKVVLYFVLFTVGALSLKRKWLKARWYFVIFLALFVATIVVSVLKPYL